MSARGLSQAAGALLLLFTATTARAQATRTWVSGVGDDANPCSRAAPCKTFAGAIGKTAAGGEIDALDSGSYGSVNITGAITIDGSAALGASDGAGASGITVAAGAKDVVTLRALSILGDGTHSGVSFTGAGTLIVESCVVAGFQEGIDFNPSAGGKLLVVNGRARNNVDAGLRVHSGGGAIASASISKSRFENNGVGILAGAGARVDVDGCVASGNATGVSAALDMNGGAAEVNLEEANVSENATAFSSTAAAGTSLIRLSKVLGTGNPTALVTVSGGGDVQSFGNNRFDVLSTIKLTAPQPSQTVMAPQSATYPLQVTVKGVLANPITFACSGLPAHTACQFTPATLPAGARGGMVTLTVTTMDQAPMMGSLNRPNRLHRSWRDGAVPWSLAAIPSIVLLGLRRPRRRAGMMLLALFLPMLLLLPSCGDTGVAVDMGAEDMAAMPSMDQSVVIPDLTMPDFTTPPDLTQIQTLPGTYKFNVTAMSGIASDMTSLSLTVN